MHLTDADRSMLAGEAGQPVRLAMELIVGVGEALDAPELLDITGAHIDSCLYHGRAGLDFANTMVEGGGQVRVPTTLNVSSLDLLHPDLYRGEATTAELARELMRAYEAMGCRPTWTCAPYQLPERPSLGEHIAWGESNAIAFANSVLGARTNRYGDFIDICCAITGRAPRVGLHTDEGRVPSIELIVDVDDSWREDDLLYVAIGHLVGRRAGTQVALITGLDERADEDRLKALGAAAASSGAIGLFHVAGVTPEAGDVVGAEMRVEDIDDSDVMAAIASLGSNASVLGAVSIGTPHASVSELRRLAELCTGLETRVPFYVNTGRDVLAAIGEESGLVEAIESFGAQFVTDTCTYITPVMGDVRGAVMTNSGKWAYYAPGNLGVEVVLASIGDCVESASVGRIVSSRNTT